MKTVNLLFTGGFDSTFRLCQLSRMEGVTVQPVYAMFSPARFNESKEIQAQDAIISLLLSKPETKATILSPIRISESTFPADPAFDKVFLKWKNNEYTPGQLHFIGKLPNRFHGLEYCIEGPTLETRNQGIRFGKTRQFLMDHGFIFKDLPDGSSTFDCSHAVPDLKILWGKFRFPIFQISETDMVPYIKEWGYEDVFKLTWTCDFGSSEPCGICHNCETKWRSGLKDFFNPNAVRNHEIKNYLTVRNDPICTADSFSGYVHSCYKAISSILFEASPIISREAFYKLVLEPQDKKRQRVFDYLVKNWDELKKRGNLDVTFNQL